jgi:formylmethanofuran dehydrogenase subunit B
MDGMALRMKKLVESSYPSDEEIIIGILESVKRQQSTAKNDGGLGA